MSNYTIKQIFQDNWNDFVLKNNDVVIRPIVFEEVNKIINCGNPDFGYALYICDHCHKTLKVPFRCKSRFCNTCGVKYAQDRALSMAKKSIRCQHRHIVFTMSDKLWFYFQKYRFLLNGLFEAASQAILSWFYELNKSQNFTPGIMCTLHTFGRDLKWNPHIHILIAELKLGTNGSCVPWMFFDYDALSKRFQNILLKLLSKALGKSFSKKKSFLYSNFPNGFYVYAEPKEFKDIKSGVEYVTRYCGRVPISENRIVNYDGSTVTFSYIAHQDNKYHEVSLDASQFIMILLRHLLPSQFKIIRYYGFYRKKHSLHTKMIPLIKQHCRNFRKSLLYHQANILLNFNRDPYNCPKCDTKMDFVLYIN